MWVANLYANVFAEEHKAPAYGPERRECQDRREELETIFKVKEVSEQDKRKEGPAASIKIKTQKRSPDTPVLSA